MPLDFDETNFMFAAPLIVLFVPQSGKRLEIIGPRCADDIATYIHDHWINTLYIRVVRTEAGHEGEGAPL